MRRVFPTDTPVPPFGMRRARARRVEALTLPTAAADTSAPAEPWKPIMKACSLHVSVYGMPKSR